MRYRLMIIVVAAAVSASAQHTGRWSLRQCISHALDHNITIRQQDISCQQRAIDVNTAKNSRLPNLNASASQNWEFGRGLTADNTYTNSNNSHTSFTLGSSVPLFTGFKTSRTIELNQLQLEAATADLEKARNDISVQVAQAYVQILYNNELCDVAQRQVTVDSLQTVRLRQMFADGKASGAQVAQQEATLAQSRLTLTQALNDRHISLLTLSQLLELPSPEGFDVEVPEYDTTVISSTADIPSPEAIYEEALVIRPEIRAEQLRLQGTEKNIGIARSALLPTLDLNAGLGTSYNQTSGWTSESFGRQMHNNFNQYVGLNLNIPLFNRFATRNNIRSARLSRDNQSLVLDNTRKALYKEIQQACYNTIAVAAKYASCQEALKSSTAAFDLMQAKYEYGKANITEFNEAKANWLKAQSDLTCAKYEYMYDTALINFYRGRNIDF